MRKPILALCLPFVLSACLDNNDAETQSSEAKPAATVQAPQPATQVEQLNNTSTAQHIAPAEKNKLPLESKQALSESLHKLTSLTHNLECDNSNQCKVLAVGSRACGGASQYIIYSTKTVKPDEVTAIADTITQYEKALNSKTGMVSICQHLSAPSAQCISNNCVKVAGSSASSF